MSSRTTIVTVAYNSADVLPRMLESITDRTPTVVVDNASTDASYEVAKKCGADTIRLERNEGFGRGCNAGASLAQTEFLLFLNPDAALANGALNGLERAADQFPDTPAFNPRIDRPGGGYEIKRRSLLVPRANWIARGLPENGAALPSLTGGALFCRRHCFETVGGFDPAIFLYHEDDDLAFRLAEEFGPLRFAANSNVIHDAGHSSGRMPSVAHFKGYHMARSKVYVMRKHSLPFPFLSTLGSALTGLLMPHNLLSSRRRAKHFGLLRGAFSALRDGGAYKGSKP